MPSEALAILISADIAQFEANMAKVETDLGRIGPAADAASGQLARGLASVGDYAKSVGSALTTYVTLPLAAVGGAALAAYGKIDSLTRGLNALATQDVGRQGATGVEAIGVAARATQARLAELTEIARAPGIGFEQAVQGDIRLRAVGISAQQSAKILREFANAIALTGGGAGELNSVTVQLGQLSAKGKVLAQDLRPIIEAAPAVSQALQQLYGTVDSETISKSLEKQGKSSTDFVAVLTEELGKLPRVAGGFNNAVENFTQGGVQNIARLGESLNKAFNLEGLLERVGTVVTRLTDYFTSLSPATQQFVFGAAAVAAAAGPIVLGLGAITAAIPSVVAGLEVMGLASTAALGPLGIGIAAVAAAAYEITAHWDELKSYFSSGGEGGAVFRDLANSVKDSVGVISQAFGALSSTGDNSLGGLVTATGILKALFRDIAVGITAFSDAAGGAIGTVVNLLSGDLSGAAAEAKRALGGLIDPLANLLGFSKAGPILSINEFLGVAAAAKAADEASLAGALSADEHTASLEANAAAATKNATTLKELNAELKAALELRFADAQAGRDTTADDANIARIRALIAEYKQLPAHADAATKAIAKLKAELAGLTVLDSVLAVPANGLDVIQRRIDLLNSGLKRLADAGVSPASAAFRAFAAESLTLQRSLDKIQASTELRFNVLTQVKLAPATLGEQFPELRATLSKELLDRPLLVPLKIQPPQLADTFGTLQTLSKSLADAGVASATFGAGFDFAGAKAEAFKRALEQMITDGVSPLSAAFQNIKQQYQEAAEQSENLRLITTSVSDRFVALGSSIAGALVNGGNVLGAILGSLIDALADYAAKKGKLLIADGTADLFTPGLQAIGALKIAGGIGLLVAAGVAHAGASSLASGGGGGGGGGSLASSPPSASSSRPASAAAPEQITITHEVVMVQKGSDLAGVLQISESRARRSTPTKRP